MEDVISLLLDAEKGVIQDKSEISAIGHRVLHGGEAITDPVLIDEKVKEIIRDCFPLGPLHNPANLMGIEVAEKLFPGVPNVGVFDTEFGMTLAPEAYLYPLPYSLYEELRIRRYGFHGTSHKYIAKGDGGLPRQAPLGTELHHDASRKRLLHERRSERQVHRYFDGPDAS